MPTPLEFKKKWFGETKKKFFHLTEDELILFSTSKEDRDFLAVTGIPKWSAPNIYLHRPENTPFSNFLKVGEDREGNWIFIAIEGKKIFWGKPEIIEEIGYLSPTMKSFLFELYFYQCMVDKALRRIGEDAFTGNKIPKDLIAQFKENIQALDPNSIRDLSTFWEKELIRVSGGTGS